MKLHNIYYGLRHGESQAMVQGIIICDPKVGEASYGLTEKGRNQVAASVGAQYIVSLPAKDTIIISSPFLRTKETAQLAAEILGVEKVTYDSDLRERNFGILHGQPIEQFDAAWRMDQAQVYDPSYGMETAQELAARVTQCIQNIEAAYAGKTILLVSHGDTLQMLEAVMRDIPPAKFQGLVDFVTGEVRKMSV